VDGGYVLDDVGFVAFGVRVLTSALVFRGRTWILRVRVWGIGEGIEDSMAGF
jgi:hypothetical protein